MFNPSFHRSYASTCLKRAPGKSLTPAVEAVNPIAQMWKCLELGATCAVLLPISGVQTCNPNEKRKGGLRQDCGGIRSLLTITGHSIGIKASTICKVLGIGFSVVGGEQ